MSENKPQVVENHAVAPSRLSAGLGCNDKFYFALLSQLKIAQAATDSIGIIGQVGSIAWCAQVRKLKPPNVKLSCRPTEKETK